MESGRGPSDAGFPTPDPTGHGSVGKGRGRGVPHTSTPVPGKIAGDRVAALKLQHHLSYLKLELEKYKVDVEMARREHQGILEEAEKDSNQIKEDREERLRQINELEECQQKLRKDVRTARQELATAKSLVKSLTLFGNKTPQVDFYGADISKIPFPGLP